MTTITDLPAELIQQIASYLPSVASIVALDLTCRSLHASISSDSYRLFRGFALSHFPSITFPPLWREATRALTTRSRAWDRKAFIGRVLKPAPEVRESHNDAVNGAPAGPRQKIGYAPALDSYEEWIGGTWADRQETLGWGAGPQVILRRRGRANISKEVDEEHTEGHSSGLPVKTEWAVMESPGGASAHEDILDFQFLHPSQRKEGIEEFVIRRANDEITKIRYDITEGNFVPEATFHVRSNPTEAMDLNQTGDPFLAVCHPDSISLFQASATERLISPCLSIPRPDALATMSRAASVKFLSPTRFAVSEQRLGQSGISPIKVYQLADDRASQISTTELSLDIALNPRQIVIPNALAPLPAFAGSGDSGHLFLAGWSDGAVRLHDDRTPFSAAKYADTVDFGMIASVMPIGHESFVAGGHENACLKLFDLRMAGSRPYSYLNARTTKQYSGQGSNKSTHDTKAISPIQADMNILLAIKMGMRSRCYDPSPDTRGNRKTRYNGSVYSLTIPSTSSRTLYAGIENHVIQLDLASTDDIMNHRLEYDWDLELDTEKFPNDNFLGLSGYNRPPPPAPEADQFISAEKVELRQQQPLSGFDLDAARQETGIWDERWRVVEYGRQRGDAWSDGRVHRF